jgi:hypothetical protein
VTHGGAAVSSAQTWTVGGRAHNVHSTGQGIGQAVLLTHLCVGQRATVLQLPAGARQEAREQATVEAF